MKNSYKFGTKLLNEYMVDIVGALIPGFLFIVTIVISLIIPLSILTNYELSNKLPNSLGWIILIVLIILSYVIGHVFYRADINDIDRKSIKRQIEKNIIRKTIHRLRKESIEDLIKEEIKLLDRKKYKDIEDNIGVPFLEQIIFDRDLYESKKKDIIQYFDTRLKRYKKYKRLRYSEKELLQYYCILKAQTKLACSTPYYGEFPYENYDKYLQRRHLKHLMNGLEWRPDGSRTKNKINKLKLDIQLFAPEAYPIINKNESHVRMSSSTCHITKSLLLITGITFIAIFLYCNIYDGNIFTVLYALFMFCLILYMRHRIITYIHYQRLREIYYLLGIYNEYRVIIQTRKRNLEKLKNKKYND
ncbi:MAG: hypothetical protein IJ748_03010 [Bacteroidales bacterium]|nr:hypothetical protein [Bacteroidales bacterium]